MSSTIGVQNISHTNGTNAMTIDNNGIVIPKGVIMQVQASNTDQAYTASNGVVKLEWESVEIDTINGWDSTNHRYTPSVAGYYLFGGSVRVNASGVNQYINLKFLKNGQDDANRFTAQIQGNVDVLGNGSYNMPTGIMQLNGSGDYIEAFIQSDEDMTVHDIASTKSHFFAQLVHAT